MGSVLHVKNMVCNRCIKVIKDEFEKIGLDIEHIELGVVNLTLDIDYDTQQKIKDLLEDNGFELIDDKKSQIIDKIKTLIIKNIHHESNVPDFNNSSDYIAKELGYDYSYLSKLFSSVVGITIEKYIINQKLEKVKELLIYDQLSLKEIAFQLGYSSVQYLSNQFKKNTGLTPSQFKELKSNDRKPLDKI